MGPTIILDKSAYQSLSTADTFELDRYFSVVVPPVLILEILADLKKAEKNDGEARRNAQLLARKIQPIGRVNLSYRTLCVSNLLGGEVPMDGRGLVGGAQPVVAKDGSTGIVCDEQPESRALLRWARAEFDAAEEALAVKWRESIRALDLEGYRRQFPAHLASGIKPSLQQVCQVVDQVLTMPEAQRPAIDSLLLDIGTIAEVGQWTYDRWRSCGCSRLREFAPYAHHCVRMSFIFYQSVLRGIVGTRSSNRIDLEYMFYSPFANVFCSGDKLHMTLARETMPPNHSFVPREDLRLALHEVAEARQKAREVGVENAADVEPAPDSLIRKLWLQYVGPWPDSENDLSDDENDELMNRIRPWLDAAEDARKKAPRRPRWPCP